MYSSLIEGIIDSQVNEDLLVYCKGGRIRIHLKWEVKRRRPSYSSIKLLEYNLLSCIPGANNYNQGLGRIKYSGENRKIKSIEFITVLY